MKKVLTSIEFFGILAIMAILIAILAPIYASAKHQQHGSPAPICGTCANYQW